MSKYQLMSELYNRCSKGESPLGVFQELINRPQVSGIVEGPFYIGNKPSSVKLGFKEVDGSSVTSIFAL